jgi:hypothetical protein
MMAALVRSSTRASRPPAASTNPVCHRSQASTRRFLCGSRAQIGLPRRVSSIPSTATGGSGAASGVRTLATSVAADHDYLLEGDVFTTDLIETWIQWKTLNEVDPIRFRPHLHEFEIYHDI